MTERDSIEAPKPSSSKFSKLTPEIRTDHPMHVIPDSERKLGRVQIKGPHDSSSVVQSTATLDGTRDQGVDPITIYLDSSTEADLSNTEDTLGSQADETAYLSAQTKPSGPSSLYLTADNGMPSGNPCASSTKKKEQETTDLVDIVLSLG